LLFSLAKQVLQAVRQAEYFAEARDDVQRPTQQRLEEPLIHGGRDAGP